MLDALEPIELSDWDADSNEGGSKVMNFRNKAVEKHTINYNDEEFESVW